MKNAIQSNTNKSELSSDLNKNEFKAKYVIYAINTNTELLLYDISRKIYSVNDTLKNTKYRSCCKLDNKIYFAGGTKEYYRATNESDVVIILENLSIKTQIFII